MTVYLDSCTVIYRVEGKEPYASLVEIMVAESSPETTFAISDLVRMECLVKPLSDGDVALANAYRGAFASLEVIEMAPPVFDRAAHLRSRSSLRTADALHLAAAMEHGCDEFWTNDTRLTGAAPNLKVRAIGPDQPTP